MSLRCYLTSNICYLTSEFKLQLSIQYSISAGLDGNINLSVTGQRARLEVRYEKESQHM